MELLLRDGDYVPDEHGGFMTVEGDAALLQWVLFQLSVRRGSFPFLPDVGSQLYLLGREKTADWSVLAEQYVVEALAGEKDLKVTGVELIEEEDGGVTLRVHMDWQGTALEGEVQL